MDPHCQTFSLFDQKTFMNFFLSSMIRCSPGKTLLIFLNGVIYLLDNLKLS